ncbi:hypothetical protein F0U62_33390 [Cystobacter fuscus]|uniref:hypothetical protein n=1 Tax=Cystobacter fuscus TaxID=43 RepID=UPI002B2F9A5D|nr:hypothetical protein F0U62_33390 [Cystobacter fuscus]
MLAQEFQLLPCDLTIKGPGPWALPPLIVLLTCICVSGCLDGVNCTSTDTTHSCCVKNHPDNPEACDGIEGMEGQAFRAVQSTKDARVPGGKVALTAAAALVLKDVDDLQSARAEIEKILEECARHAEEEINRKRLGGRKPGKDECDQKIGKTSKGEPTTQAMRWGLEKHKVARECAGKALTQLLPRHFSLEQRYRFDLATGRKSLVSKEAREELMRQGREKELEGTLEPDVVIHSGDPLQAWAIYDFKFRAPGKAWVRRT